MTKEQAFREWCQDDWDKERMEECWNAACEWQKQYDANLIYTEGDKKYQPYVEHVEEEIRKICAGEIMCS